MDFTCRRDARRPSASTARRAPRGAGWAPDGGSTTTRLCRPSGSVSSAWVRGSSSRVTAPTPRPLSSRPSGTATAGCSTAKRPRSRSTCTRTPAGRSLRPAVAPTGPSCGLV